MARYFNGRRHTYSSRRKPRQCHLTNGDKLRQKQSFSFLRGFFYFAPTCCYQKGGIVAVEVKNVSTHHWVSFVISLFFFILPLFSDKYPKFDFLLIFHHSSINNPFISTNVFAFSTKVLKAYTNCILSWLSGCLSVK